jgi:NhaP-type Na+/H+ or K+/H+ antiporter
MLDIIYALAGFCLVIFIGFIAESIFDWTHVPDILLLFIIGIIIGPVLGWVKPEDFSSISQVFVTLALVLIIFAGGINIKINDFLKGATKGSILAAAYFVTSIFIVTSVMVIFGYKIELGLLLGIILGGTSSAIVIPMVKLLKVHSETSIILTLESALTDVFCIVGAITMLEIIETSTLHVRGVLMDLIMTFLVSMIIGALSAVLWTYAKKKIPSLDKAYMMTLATIILIYVMGEVLFGNGAISVLAFSLVLGNIKQVFTFLGKDSEYNLTPSEKNFFEEISFFLKVFFFVYLGILISFDEPFLIFLGFMIAMIAALVRPYIIGLTMRRLHNLPPRDKVVMSLMTAQGLASAALVQIILISPVLSNYPQAKDLSQVTLSVILFSIIFTSGQVILTERRFHAELSKDADEGRTAKNR